MEAKNRMIFDFTIHTIASAIDNINFDNINPEATAMVFQLDKHGVILFDLASGMPGIDFQLFQEEIAQGSIATGDYYECDEYVFVFENNRIMTAEELMDLGDDEGINKHLFNYTKHLIEENKEFLSRLLPGSIQRIYLHAGDSRFEEFLSIR
jgi:hypothetical protein